VKPKYTASALERVFECPASVHLPQVLSSNRNSNRGTDIHAFVRRVLAGMPVDEALTFVDPANVPVCRLIDFQKLGGDLKEVRAEVAYAWDVDARTARELGVNIGRNYDVEVGEIAGTNDIEGVRIDDIPVVCDVKTGDAVTRCEDNAQMLYHALVRRQRTRAREVQARILYIGHDGSVNVDQSTFDRATLDAFADELAECADAVGEAELEIERYGYAPVSKGPWCKYCPAMSACPAFVGLARAQVVELDDMVTRIAAFTPEQQGQAWVIAKQAETLAEAVLEALKGLARQSPIPLPDGSIVRPVQVMRDDFNRAAAVALLRKLGASSADVSALFKKHQVEQIRRIAAPKVRKAKPRVALDTAQVEAPQLEAHDEERVA
jgi:hypothetical protein